MLGRLVTLETYMNAMQAHLAKNQLEAAGIRGVLADEFAATTYWHLSNAIGGIKLQVAEEDFERAAVVLDSFQKIRYVEDDADVSEESSSLPVEGSASPESPPPPHEEDEEPKLNSREQNAERAYRAALFGFMFFPLQFYATWLLLDVWQADHPLRPAVRRKLYWAIGFNVPMVLVATAATLFWLRALVYGADSY